MPLVFAAVVPHAPLLLLSVAKEHHHLLRLTLDSMSTIGHELYSAQADTIVVLTPHGPSFAESFVVGMNETLQGDLSEFGDIITIVPFSSDLALAQAIKQSAMDHHAPCHLQTFETVDYGVTVPMIALGLPKIPPIVMIATHDQSFDALLRFGASIRDALAASPKRVAIVASGDFSRRAEKSTVEKRRPTAIERQLSQAITANDITKMTDIKGDRVCAYAPVALLLSVLQGAQVQTNILSFEAPFGVGQIVARIQPQA